MNRPQPPVRPLLPVLLAGALAAACKDATVTVSHPDWPVGFELSTEAQPAYERVVLVTIDTLRADHCSVYGYVRETTPFLDRLAEDGVLFERAVASISHTAPSHATMLTGLPPAAHGVVWNGLTLPGEAVDMALLFQTAGYETAAFVNVKFLTGVATNFDVTGVQLLQGGPVADAAIQWLREERTSDRFLMWVHLYDPHHWKHAKRTPAAELRELRAGTAMDRAAFYGYLEELHGLRPQQPGEPFDLGWTVEVKDSHTLPTPDADAYLDFVDAYDAQILYADRQLERLYRTFEELGIGDDSLWIVTSDHGEGLASHEVAGHGGRIYQEQLLVPLVFHATDGSLPAGRVDALVQHTDLLPTVAEALGARLTGLQAFESAASLWPLLRGEAGWTPRPAFSQRRPMMHDDPDAQAISALQTETHKYIRHEPGDDEFFDLATDPLELRNVVDQPSPERDRLREELEAHLRRARERGRKAAKGEIPAEWVEELRDLGYAGGSDG